MGTPHEETELRAAAAAVLLPGTGERQGGFLKMIGMVLETVNGGPEE